MAMVPGSSKVFDRETKELVACTKELCSDSYVNKRGEKVYYNMAPMQIGGLYGAVNSMVSIGGQRAAYKFMSYIASPDVSGPFNVFDPISPAGPTFTEHLYDTPGNNFSTSRRILEHPNLMPELRIHLAQMHRESISKAADTFNNNTNASIAKVLEINYQEMKNIIAASGPLEWPKYYWDALQYIPDSPPPAPPLTSPPQALDLLQHQGFTEGQLEIIIIIPTIVALLIIIIAILVIRGSINRKLLNPFSAGDALPSGDSPNTTLVVTDIESSTNLWEKLDATVMDSALTIHHAVIREIARKHRGYENGTEGDSFTIAFHTARSAVLFAVESQAKLVTCNWPEALLKLPLCEPKYFTPLERPSSDSAVQVSFLGPNSTPKQPIRTLSSIIEFAMKSCKNLADLSHRSSPVKFGRDTTQSDLDECGHQTTFGTTEIGLMPTDPASQLDEPFSVPAHQPGGGEPATTMDQWLI
eukprot:gene26778-4362_t